MRILKDIWVLVRHIMPQAWKVQRHISKMEYMIMKMEKKLGVVGCFLHHFELNAPENSDELNKEILEMFLMEIYSNEQEVVEEITSHKDWNAVLSYCKQYNIKHE